MSLRGTHRRKYVTRLEPVRITPEVREAVSQIASELRVTWWQAAEVALRAGSLLLLDEQREREAAPIDF
jgi:hypothetical protein